MVFYALELFFKYGLTADYSVELEVVQNFLQKC